MKIDVLVKLTDWLFPIFSSLSAINEKERITEKNYQMQGENNNKASIHRWVFFHNCLRTMLVRTMSVRLFVGLCWPNGLTCTQSPSICLAENKINDQLGLFKQHAHNSKCLSQTASGGLCVCVWVSAGCLVSTFAHLAIFLTAFSHFDTFIVGSYRTFVLLRVSVCVREDVRLCVFSVVGLCVCTCTWKYVFKCFKVFFSTLLLLFGGYFSIIFSTILRVERA